MIVGTCTWWGVNWSSFFSLEQSGERVEAVKNPQNSHHGRHVRGGEKVRVGEQDREGTPAQTRKDGAAQGRSASDMIHTKL